MSKYKRLVGTFVGIASSVIGLSAFAQTTDYTASISATFVAYVTPLVNGSWHYLVITMAISAGFAIFYFAWHKFRGMVRR